MVFILLAATRARPPPRSPTATDLSLQLQGRGAMAHGHPSCDAYDESQLHVNSLRDMTQYNVAQQCDVGENASAPRGSVE